MLIGLLTYMWGEKKYLAHHGLAPIHCKTEICDETRANLDKPLTKEDKQRILVNIYINVF